MTTEQNYVGKDCYATAFSQTVKSDQTPPAGPTHEFEFTPRMFQVPVATQHDQPLFSVSVLLEALFCYQDHLNTLAEGTHQAQVTVDALIVQALDAAQVQINDSLVNAKKGGVSHAL